MEFKQIVMNRYATKKFDERKIPAKKLEELEDLIRFSASSFNIQPWKVKVISDDETKKKLAPLAWNQAQITTCSHLLIFCADTDIDGLIDKLEQTIIAKGSDKEKISGYVKVMRDFAKRLNPEQKLAWAQRQVYIALGNALNGAKALGFDSCPMEGFDPKGFATTLKLPKMLIPTVLCPIGYAADEPLAKVRFEREAVFI